MRWFKKKTPILNIYEKMINEFNLDINDIKTIEYNNHINKTYRDIKKYYEERIKDKSFNISSEKIIVEQDLGIIPNNVRSMSLTFFVAVVGTIFYFVIQIVLKLFDKYSDVANFYLSLAFLFLMILYLGATLGKDIKKDNPRNLMLYISLQVLKDIEKEMEYKASIKSTQEEIALTELEEDKTKDYYKADGNFMISVNTLSIYDIVHGVYKTVRLVRRIFKKKEDK